MFLHMYGYRFMYLYIVNNSCNLRRVRTKVKSGQFLRETVLMRISMCSNNVFADNYSITISRDYGSFVKASNRAGDTQIHLRPAHAHTHTHSCFLFHQFSLESHTWQHGRQPLQRCQRTTGVQTADTGRSQH